MLTFLNTQNSLIYAMLDSSFDNFSEKKKAPKSHLPHDVRRFLEKRNIRRSIVSRFLKSINYTHRDPFYVANECTSGVLLRSIGGDEDSLFKTDATDEPSEGEKHFITLTDNTYIIGRGQNDTWITLPLDGTPELLNIDGTLLLQYLQKSQRGRKNKSQVVFHDFSPIEMAKNILETKGRMAEDLSVADAYKVIASVKDEALFAYALAKSPKKDFGKVYCQTLYELKPEYTNNAFISVDRLPRALQLLSGLYKAKKKDAGAKMSEGAGVIASRYFTYRTESSNQIHCLFDSIKQYFDGVKNPAAAISHLYSLYTLICKAEKQKDAKPYPSSYFNVDKDVGVYTHSLVNAFNQIVDTLPGNDASIDLEALVSLPAMKESDTRALHDLAITIYDYRVIIQKALLDDLNDTSDDKGGLELCWTSYSKAGIVLKERCLKELENYRRLLDRALHTAKFTGEKYDEVMQRTMQVAEGFVKECIASIPEAMQAFIADDQRQVAALRCEAAPAVNPALLFAETARKRKIAESDLSRKKKSGNDDDEVFYIPRV